MQQRIAKSGGGNIKMIPRMSPCAQHYLRALTDPFDWNGPLPCVPDLHVLPSRKTMTIKRGTMACGLIGMGFINVEPMGMFSNNNTSLMVSEATYNGNTVRNSPLTGVDAVANTQAPYDDAGLSNGISARLVACGVRIRYRGTELERGGTIVLAREPDGRAINNIPVSTLLDWTPTSRAPCDRSWHHVNWRPTTKEDFEYQSTATVGAFCMAIAIEGANPGNVFEYEVVSFIEYVGAVPDISKSHSDITGMSVIRGALPTVNTIGSAQAEHEAVKAEAEHDFWSSFTGLLPEIVGAGKQVGEFVSGALNTAEQIGAAFETVGPFLWL